ncbi:MAG: hypothetical protein ACFE95_14110 [Candidatus Hodarchaeota archaeon]
MNWIQLDFKAAKDEKNDLILKSIIKEALTFLLNHIDTSKTKCILLTGSLANAEGTVIRYNTYMITSDFDFVIYLDFLYYLRKKTYFQILSQEMSKRLNKRGFKTHVDFLPTTSALRLAVIHTKSNIYEYEFAHASKCVIGIVPSFNKAVRPSKRDALELIFTVISELIFLTQKKISKIEESYIYAKRALTLLNSLLIFHGYFGETYEKRIQIVKSFKSLDMFPINEADIETLELFTKYKLSSSFQSLLNSQGYNQIDDLLFFQKEFLEKLTKKILHYELVNIVNSSTKKNFRINGSPKNLNFELPILLEEYLKLSKARLYSIIMGLLLCLFWTITRNKKRQELFKTFIFHQQPPKTILNVIITLLYVYGDDVYLEKILKHYFPRIDFNNEIIMNQIFSLWQTVEQSIKLY